MDSIIIKLENFGLDNFITSHRHEFCSKTVNQNQVAAFLRVGADQTAIIMHPPDNYSRNEKLYDAVARTATVKTFVQGLQATGNGHVLTFIQSASMDSSTAASISSSKHGIWFSIPQLIHSFFGREQFLLQLDAKMQEPVEESLQINVISGLGGMGKTQTVRKYISKYIESFQNFIWIDAESESSMRNSFVKLADELKIPVENSEGKSRDIDKIVADIYNKICGSGKSTLIIFDNAEDLDECGKFLPFLSHPKMRKPKILVTSRNQEWPLTSTFFIETIQVQIQIQIQVFPLDVLTNSECFEFILTKLKFSDCPEFRYESMEFIKLIGGLPLALQQAVAYIKRQLKSNSNPSLGRPYKISDYVHEFKSRMKTPHEDSTSPVPAPGASSTTVVDTWNVTFEKILGLENGEEAIKILEFLSFLYADNIPLNFIRSLVPEIQQEIFTSSLRLLKKYSLIKIQDNVFNRDSTLSIHRQLQFAVLQGLQSSKNKMLTASTSVLEKCRVALQAVKLAESSDLFLNIHQIVKNPFNLIPMSENFVDFISEFAYILGNASRYGESLDLYQKVHVKYMDVLDEENPKVLKVQYFIGRQLMELAKYDESLALLRETLRRQQVHPDLGTEHLDTIGTRYCIAFVLKMQKKYSESLTLFQQVLEERRRILGENDPSTLSVHNMIALINYELGNFALALPLFEELEKKEIEVLGVDHKIVTSTGHNKASVLYSLGRFQEASAIFQEVYEKRKQLLGENHVATTMSLEWTGNTLYAAGKWAEALNVQRKVYDIRRETLGEDHPYTIHTKTNIARVSHNIKAKNEQCAIA